MQIAIASGKGGTGKTLVAVSLALALAAERRLQLLDCDVEEPNDHLFLNPAFERTEAATIPVPVVNESRCTHCGTCAEVCAYHALAVLPSEVLPFHQLCHGCGACSYLCPEKAIHEEPRQMGRIDIGRAEGIELIRGTLNVGEAMAPPVIRQVKKHIAADAIAVIDASPGTSCPVIEAIRGSDYCLLVTDPTPFGLNDLSLAVRAVWALGIPCGVALNRSGDNDSQTEAYCRREAIPILMKIPLDMEIARMYSKGIPLVRGKPEWRARFLELYRRIEESVR